MISARVWVSVFALFVASCVQPRTGNSTDAWTILPKSYFEGTGDWYLAMTVIEAPPNAGFAFTGDGSLGEVIRWEVRENALYAYRAYSTVVGLDPDVAGYNNGRAPVAVFPIRRHLSLSAGQQVEPPNVPWYGRTHIEVDWRNQATGSFDMLADDVKMESPGYIDFEPASANAPIFSTDYIDFVHHFVATPTESLNPDTGDKNTGCADWANIEWVIDCAPTEIAIRTSLMRLNNRPAYLERQFIRDDGTNNPFSGMTFYNGRWFVDSRYGFTNTGRHIVYTRFNIWATSVDQNGQPLPVRSRQVRTIPYYVSDNWPSELIPVVERALNEWNSAFETTIRSARRLECRADPTDSNCDRFLQEHHQVVLFCPNNPVKMGDPRVCGLPGTHVRSGDVRYNILVWHTIPTVQNIVGTGWWWPNQKTGEIIATQANLYAPAINRIATYATDTIQIMNGGRYR